jgi:hypothetical protein
MSWAPRARAPRQKVRLYTRRQLHALQRAEKTAQRGDRKQERSIEKYLARQDAKEAAARKGCVT